MRVQSRSPDDPVLDKEAVGPSLPGMRRSVWIRFWLPIFDLQQITGATRWQKSEARRYNTELMRNWGTCFVLRWVVVFLLACLGLAAAGRLNSQSLVGAVVQGVTGLLWLAALSLTAAMVFLRQVVLHPLTPN